MADPDPFDTPFDIERSPLLEGIPHGFFGSRGGVHQFGYGGPGDEQAVRRLRAAAAKAILPGAPLQAPHQVHSPEVVTIAKAWPDAARDRPVADAVVTNRTDVVLGIVTADCAPVLMADRDAQVIAAAHAGWRGAVCAERGSVLENTLAAMEGLGARRDRIVAVVGPTIAQSSYEVDAAFREHFTDQDDVHFAAAPMREGVERWHFDLPGYIIARLGRVGVVDAVDLAQDTFSQDQKYHSYRRAALNGEPNYGRQLSTIALK
jgi:YfiH family protein